MGIGIKWIAMVKNAGFEQEVYASILRMGRTKRLNTVGVLWL